MRKTLEQTMVIADHNFRGHLIVLIYSGVEGFGGRGFRFQGDGRTE